MILFFDTSALIKRYIQEKGSNKVDLLMNEADRVIVSAITEIETCSAFRRLLSERAVTEGDYRVLMREFETDYPYFTRVDLDDLAVSCAKYAIGKYRLKTLDSIQLGTALAVRDDIDYFVACDARLTHSARKEGLHVINPMT